MKKIMCAFLILLLLKACGSSPKYNLKDAGSILIYKRDMVTYSIEYKEHTDNTLTFYVSVNNNTDTEYPLYIKHNNYISSVTVNNTTIYDTAQYIWYYGEIKYDDNFTMMITLNEEGKKVFNSKCDFNMGESYLPTDISILQKAHYLDILLNS